MAKDPDIPTGPNPEQVIRTQARLNRPDTFTPFGSLTFQDTAEGPNTAAQLRLAPEQQQLLSGQNQVGIQSSRAALNRIGQIPSGGFNTEGLPEQVSQLDTSGFADTPFDRANVEEALFERQAGLLRPEFERQERDLRQTLANQGLPGGGEAFNDQFQQFNRDRNRAFERAAQTATIRAAGQARRTRQQQLQEALSQVGLQNQARQQGLSERQILRNQPIQEIQGLLGLAQPQMPQSAGARPVDVSGPFQAQANRQTQGALTANRNQQNFYGGLLSLGGSLGSAALMA